MFVGGKALAKKTGMDLLGMIRKMNTGGAQASVEQEQKRKMRGPNINLSDVEEAHRADQV